jgi:hypothetical protein
MAEVRGRKCDRPECTTFVTDAPNMPSGWIQVMPKRYNGKTEGFELCSNYCAAFMFMDRYEAESGKRIQRKSYRKRVEEGLTQPLKNLDVD